MDSLPIAFTRESGEIVWSNTLLETPNGDIDTSGNYAAEDALHSGLLIFPSVFLNEDRGRAIIKNVHFYVNDTTLWLPDLRLMLFNKNECDIAPGKNNPVDFTANCTYEHTVCEPVDLPGVNWKSQSHKHSGTTYTYHAKACISVDKIISNKPLAAVLKSVDLVGYVLVKGSTLSKFQAGARFKVGLEIIQL